MDVYLPSDRATGRPRGFAFVEFSSEEEAAAAIEQFDGKELEGRPLKINPAEARPRRPPSPGFRRDFSDGPPSFGGGGGGGGNAPGRPPGKPKGSRRGLRGKKRSL